MVSTACVCGASPYIATNTSDLTRMCFQTHSLTTSGFFISIGIFAGKMNSSPMLEAAATRGLGFGFNETTVQGRVGVPALHRQAAGIQSLV